MKLIQTAITSKSIWMKRRDILPKTMAYTFQGYARQREKG